MKTILATAYAVNPYKGSEDGTGWNLIHQIARFHKVIAVTRKNNRPYIDQFLLEHPNSIQSRITFVYFDLPYWMMFWKKGERGALLYFYLWQLFMPLFILRKKLKYDVLHNLNFHNDWTPTFLWVLRKPLVWGPVGHHPKTPEKYIKEIYGVKEYVKSRLLWVIKKMFWNGDPFLKLALWNSDAVITMNSGVEKVHGLNKQKLYRMPAVGAELPVQKSEQKDGKFIFLSVGRLVAMKGFDLTLAAFAQFYFSLNDSDQERAQLRIVGRGPLLDSLQMTIEHLGLQQAVFIQEWVEKEQMPFIYSQASAFFFPSHEGAGMVVPEALSYGLPVVCFDNEGPGEFIDASCGIKIPYSFYEQSVAQFADALGVLYYNKEIHQSLSKGAVNKFKQTFTWEVKGDLLKEIYANINSIKS